MTTKKPDRAAKIANNIPITGCDSVTREGIERAIRRAIADAVKEQREKDAAYVERTSKGYEGAAVCGVVLPFTAEKYLTKMAVRIREGRIH
jgi:transcriptional/translational regulatory protein YebC/TACO1